jgi:hypothetical protein
LEFFIKILQIEYFQEETKIFEISCMANLLITKNLRLTNDVHVKYPTPLDMFKKEPIMKEKDLDIFYLRECRISLAKS